MTTASTPANVAFGSSNLQGEVDAAQFNATVRVWNYRCYQQDPLASLTLHYPIINMGLSKTGTTAVATALKQLGLRVSHGVGDQIYHTQGHCDAISNTLEDSYEMLDKRHPTARWIITYSANETAWLSSLQGHLARWGPTQIGARTVSYTHLTLPTICSV